MPDGRVHSAATFGLILNTGILSSGVFTTNLQWANFAAGQAVGWLLSPDLDVDNGFIGFYYVRRVFGPFGPLVAFGWQLFWKPYAWIIPHRSPLSHFPILGTLLRCIYLFWLPCLVLLWSGWHGQAWMFWVIEVIFPAFAGLCTSDLSHYLMDKA